MKNEKIVSYMDLYQITQEAGGNFSWSDRNKWCMETGLIDVGLLEESGEREAWIQLSDTGDRVVIQSIFIHDTDRIDTGVLYCFVYQDKIWLLNTLYYAMKFSHVNYAAMVLRFRWGRIVYTHDPGFWRNDDIQRNLDWLITGHEPDLKSHMTI